MTSQETTPTETATAEADASEPEETTPGFPEGVELIHVQGPRSDAKMYRFSHMHGKMVPA